MSEIDTAEERADLLEKGVVSASYAMTYLDEIDRLRAQIGEMSARIETDAKLIREADRLKEGAGLLYISAIRDGDIARAELATAKEDIKVHVDLAVEDHKENLRLRDAARASALEEAASEIEDFVPQWAERIRSLASGGKGALG